MEQYAAPAVQSPGVTVGELYDFRMDYYQQLQCLFFSKPLCWAYEEEVHIVECLPGLEDDETENQSGRF